MGELQTRSFRRRNTFNLTRNIAPLRFGCVEGGNLKLWQRMADFVRARGGEGLTRCEATRLGVEGGRVMGAVLRSGAGDVEVRVPVVVSNLGLHAAVRWPAARRSSAAIWPASSERWARLPSCGCTSPATSPCSTPVSHRMPVLGLFDVGDASCPRGFAGSMGVAQSALLVRDDPFAAARTA